MASKRGRGARSREEAAGPGPERIQKILARAGFGSRRACEVLIVDGRVRVDGEIVRELGAKADIETQEIFVDQKPVRAERPVYYLLNKPKGTLCTLSDPEGRRTVQDHLHRERRRVFPVGRLDMDSRGAVILTNDGRFTNLLTHPRYGVEKTYLARVRGSVDDGAVGKLRHGVWLAEGKTLPARVWIVKRTSDETELGLAICEGKNRQVRRMLAAVGYKVQALTRTRVGPITLKGLREGDYRELTRDEVEELTRIAKRNAGAPPPPWAKGRSSRARSLGKPDPNRPPLPEGLEPAAEDEGEAADFAPATVHEHEHEHEHEREHGHDDEHEHEHEHEHDDEGDDVPFTPAPPRPSRPAPPRGNRSGPPRGDRAGPPRGGRSGPPRGDRAGPPRGDRSGPPRGRGGSRSSRGSQEGRGGRSGARQDRGGGGSRRPRG